MTLPIAESRTGAMRRGNSGLTLAKGARGCGNSLILRLRSFYRCLAPNLL